MYELLLLHEFGIKASKLCLAWDFIDDEGRKFWRRIAKEQNKNATDEEAKTCFESFDTEKWCKDSLEDEPQFFSLSSSKP